MPQIKQYADANARLAAYRERKRIAKADAERIEWEAQQTQWKERQALRQAAGQTISTMIEKSILFYGTYGSGMEHIAEEKLGRPLTSDDRQALHDAVVGIQHSLSR